jgi:hypothetical protein
MAVQRSRNIARVSIDDLSLDYVGSPTLGICGAFFVLTKEEEKDWDRLIIKMFQIFLSSDFSY